MLCLAAPSWSAVPQCVDPVRQVLHDIARGRPFPSCPDANGSSAAANHWASAPSYCPPQYTRAYELLGSTAYDCAYSGAIEVDVNGVLWARTWWNLLGDSVTEFTPTAKAGMRDWNTRFDDDYARWVATQPPVPAPCITC